MNPLVFLGPSAAGKSTFGKKLTELLNDGGIPTELLTSKQYLGRQVLADAEGKIPDKRGWIETPDMVLYNPLEATITSFSAKFKTGKPFNDGHQELIFEAARLHQEDGGKVFRIIEIANGPVKKWGDGAIPTLQTGAHYLNWMKKAGILQPAYGLLVTVLPGLRAMWNENREEGVIPPEPFDDTYPDYYNYHDFDHTQFGQGFTYVENNFSTPEKYLRHMVVTFHDQIAKQCGIEGFTLPPEYQDGGRRVEGGRGW